MSATTSSSAGALDRSARRDDKRLTHGRVVGIAAPIILSNVTQPLIGVADTAVLGQLGDAHLIGAVAVGATIFSMLYWAFGFLRMGTSGLTAQADGAREPAEVAANLLRALAIAGAMGLGLVVLQWPIAGLAFWLIDSSEAVEQAASQYFAIRIWTAPAALANFAILGWLIGLGRTGLAFVVQLFLNLLNIALDVILVLGLGYGIAGVAAGTLAAEVAAAAFGLIVVARLLRRKGAHVEKAALVDRRRLVRTLSVNRDIMIRTLLLLFSFAFFVAQGARAGDTTLAVNAVLQHFLMVSAYLLDGFAFTGEVLVGNAVGARDRAYFRRAAIVSSLWAGGLALAVSIVLITTGGLIIDFMTVNAEVRALARQYLSWAAAMPVLGVACFQLDGIFIGATRTVDMRNMMIVSFLAYIAAWALLTPLYGNHGLWAALSVLFVARALTLAVRLPALERDAFAGPDGVGRAAA